MTRDPEIYLDHVLALACFASGAADIISFEKCGGVFASAMTGNLAFLALHAAHGLQGSLLAPVLSLVSFFTGASLAALLARGKTKPRALSLLLAGEACLLLLFTFSRSTGVSIMLLSAAMGMQIVSGRTANRAGIPTVVFTSTLTSIVIETVNALGSGRPVVSAETLRRGLAVVGYFAGAVVAGVAIVHKSAALDAIPALPVIIALAIHALSRRRLSRAPDAPAPTTATQTGPCRAGHAPAAGQAGR